MLISLFTYHRRKDKITSLTAGPCIKSIHSYPGFVTVLEECILIPESNVVTYAAVSKIHMDISLHHDDILS